MSVYVCRNKHPLISGVHIAGMLRTLQSCQGCMYIAGMVQTSQYCQCMLQECFKHPNNIRDAYCRKASNTPIMSGVYVCCRNASNTQSCQCMLQECFWSSKNILGYARTTPPYWLSSHHLLYLVSNTIITLLSHHYKHYHKHKLLHRDNRHFIMSELGGL